jgi:hypothetical protein
LEAWKVFAVSGRLSNEDLLRESGGNGNCQRNEKGGGSCFKRLNGRNKTVAGFRFPLLFRFFGSYLAGKWPLFCRFLGAELNKSEHVKKENSPVVPGFWPVVAGFIFLERARETARRTVRTPKKRRKYSKLEAKP